jgi:hypothetical protein
VTWLTVLGQGVILAVAVLGFLSTRRGVTKVHKLVNNQLDRQLTYNQQLAATLTKAGVPVPPQDEPAELSRISMTSSRVWASILANDKLQSMEEPWPSCFTRPESRWM